MGRVRPGPAEAADRAARGGAGGAVPAAAGRAGRAGGPLETGWALLATAALDAALALRARAAAVPGALLATAALLVGAADSWSAATAADAVAPAGLLLAGAALGTAAAWREPRALAAALVGGLAVVVALGGVARPSLDPAWAVVAHLLVALPLLAGVRVHALPAAVRRGLARAGAVVAALAALAGWSAVAPTLLTRIRVLDEVWAATSPAGDPFVPGAAVPVTLLIAAGAAWWLSRTLSRPEPHGGGGGLGLGRLVHGP